MNAKTFVNQLPEPIKNQIIAESNAPVLETEENLIDAITENPDGFEALIKEYAPEWAEEMWGETKKLVTALIKTEKRADGYTLIDEDGNYPQEGFTYDTEKEAYKAAAALWPANSVWEGRKVEGGYEIVIERERVRTVEAFGTEYDLRELENKYGTLKAEDGTTIYLTQEAYVVDDTTYKAMAIDEEGNDYDVFWETTAEWDDLDAEDQEDESKACDWDKYSVTRN